MRLLLAENDHSRGSTMHAALGRAGYAIDWVQTSVHLKGALTTHRYDCAVLDLPMPDAARDSLLPHMRQEQPHLPVIVVTAAGAIEDRVALLDQGADDCLARPFHVDELTARIRSLLRRSKPVGDAPEALVHGSIQLLPQRYSAKWGQREVRLTHCEFSVLEVLVRKKNQIVSRAQLEESLYGWGEEVNSNAIEVYIHYLRRKFYPGLIVTVRGLGYQLAAEPA